MPLNNPAPQFALLSAWDMRSLSGDQLFTRSGGGAVSMPTFSAGDGVYEDVLFFLNGRGSSSSLKAQGQLEYGGLVGGVGTTWTATINEDDKVEISSDVDFTLTKTGTDDPLGFGSSTLNATLVGSDYVITAPNDWTRGFLSLSDVTYRIDEVGSSDNFNFPLLLSDIQDVSVFIRGHDEGDADDFGLSSLQELDNTAQARTDITWTITDEGFTRCYYPTSKGDVAWTSTTLRDLLGFTGNETAVVDGTFSRVTSTHKNAGVLLPSRPYQSHHLKVENVGQSRRKIGGGYVSNFIGSYVTSSLAFDLDALLDESDDYRHFTERFAPLVGPGERINFYQGWGDSRRALRTAQVVGSQEAYDLLYTSEDNGDQGRIRGSLISSDFDLAYPTRLRRRVPVSLEIEHL
jgi:hypothetical protein